VFVSPNDNRAREVLIVSLCRNAAALNDPDGLNNFGSCYVTGYDDIAIDFDKLVNYWVRAIAASSLVACENLGAHYGTGMNGAR
jgi:TPR repeat protein